MSETIHMLTKQQMNAVIPSQQIWLNAAAGTGKTQVLSARVLRLLLQKDIKPQDILCITFTKAGSAEMENRINKRLASWVRMKGTTLARELLSIGADNSPEIQNRARQLFASLLDAPGGGLRVMTIHSFCQTLLSSFPGEASLNNGFRAIDDREQPILYQETLQNMCEAYAHDPQFIKALEQLSLLYGEERTLSYLQKWARNPEAAAYWQEGEFGETLAKHLVGCTVEGDLDDYLIEVCQDANFDLEAVRECADRNSEWNTKTGLVRVVEINDWLRLKPQERGERLLSLHSCWSTQSHTLAQQGPNPKEEYLILTQKLFDWSMEIINQSKLYKLAQRLHNSFMVGKRYSEHYNLIKEQQSVVDYDDLIRKSAALLKTANMADWIRYKLDQQIDHILIDEAQDTNESQWNIIKALSDDFYSGDTAHENKLRTIFTVGDFKQAIFGFQGTSPQNYQNARNYFIDKLQSTDIELRNLILSESFRSSKPILDIVNKVIEIQGYQSFGLEEHINKHSGVKGDCGEILLLEPVISKTDDEGNHNEDQDTDDDKWMAEEKRVLAHKLTDYIANLLTKKEILETTGKVIKPSDIMILLKKRGDLASLIVSRLHAKNIPVAGIDRLLLTKPLAVQDLLSAIQFVLQPEDDLNLATVLTSPLIGMSHDDFLTHGYRQHNISLWQHIKRDQALAEYISDLSAWLEMADYGTPYQFLEKILSGRFQGRKKIYARLGLEAEMGVNELLNAALEYSRNEGPSLQGFLDWVMRSDVEITRENNSEYDEVQVMTVHGSKGLQAPIVILADICVDPTRSPDNSFEFEINNTIKLPLPSLDKDSRIGNIAQAWDQKQKLELEEHNRLLYVALTRSEERLIVTGSMGKRGVKNGAIEPPKKSWYHPIKEALLALNCDEYENEWGLCLHYKGSNQAVISKKEDKSVIETLPVLESYLLQDVPQENRPPKPLAPSHLPDDTPYVPINDNIKRLAERGNLIHKLFEYLTQNRQADIRIIARQWYNRQHIVHDWTMDQIIEPVLNILMDEAFKGFFGNNVRSEVPIAAVVGDSVINGRIDHLAVRDNDITAIDFKTGSKTPEDNSQIPKAYIKQMAHYAAALEKVFPQKNIQTALLYTNNPKLMMLTNDDIEAYKPKNIIS